MLVSDLKMHLQAPWKKYFGKLGNPCDTDDWANETGAKRSLVVQLFDCSLIWYFCKGLDAVALCISVFLMTFVSTGNYLCYLTAQSIIRCSLHTKQFILISQVAVRSTERWSAMSKVTLQIMANLVIKQRFHQSCVSSLHYLPLVPLLGPA